MVIKPAIAAVSRTAVSKKPCVFGEPKVHSAGPTDVNAVPMLLVAGQISRV
jgi:hypothetical protein